MGVPNDKVTVIPNASDLDLFRPDADGSAQRKRLGLGERFAAIYFGAMGLANGLDYVIESARILAERGKGNIVLVLHGFPTSSHDWHLSVDRLDQLLGNH